MNNQDLTDKIDIWCSRNNIKNTFYEGDGEVCAQLEIRNDIELNSFMPDVLGIDRPKAILEYKNKEKREW